MSGVNKVILIGRLGRDPEMRRTQAGDPVVSFSLATSEAWRDKSTGERKENVQWHNIVIFNEALTTIATQYLKKGSQCYVEGKLKTRAYADRDGVERKVTEIVLERFGGTIALLDKAEQSAPDAGVYGETKSRPSQNELDDPRMSMGSKRPLAAQIDDDIPF